MNERKATKWLKKVSSTNRLFGGNFVNRTKILQAGIFERFVSPPAAPINLAAIPDPVIAVKLGATKFILAST